MDSTTTTPLFNSLSSKYQAVFTPFFFSCNLINYNSHFNKSGVSYNMNRRISGIKASYAYKTPFERSPKP